MRLSAKIQDALTEEFARKVSPVLNSELHLFGSRADPLKKGGDIDLLFITDRDQKAIILSEIASLRASLRTVARDQRVDLTVCTKEELKVDPFLLSIGETVLLRRF